jgi:hypothetical protein
MGSKGGNKGPTGFRYRFAIHMGLCRGPIDELVEIRVADKVAWAGSLGDDSDLGELAQPWLFGGDKKEGGMVGGFALLMGKATQDLVSRTVKNLHSIGTAVVQDGTYNIRDMLVEAGLTRVPGFRGVASIFYRGVVATNNPYPKEWKMRVRRSTKGWHNDDCWYHWKARILLGSGATAIHAMNPAHILYECATNPIWGRGLPRDMLDDAAWTSAANTLCDEGFGLCVRWVRTDDLDSFMATIINTIGGAIYVDRRTGLLVLKLLRDDYEPADLPLFDPDSGLLGIDGDDTGSGENSVNEVVVTYRTPLDGGSDRKVRAHNLGAIESAGAIVSTTTDYSAIPTPELAGRVAVRDLAMASSGLKRYKITMDRRAWKIQPLDVIRISYPARGIADVVLRVGKIDGKLTITAVQDVFGLPLSGFTTYTDRVWTPPDRTAYPITEALAFEASYRDVKRRVTAADFAALDETSGAIFVVAKKPSSLSVNYNLLSAADGGTLTDRGTGIWSGTATLTDAVGIYDTSIVAGNRDRLTATAEGMAALLGTEQVEIVTVGADTLTIARGTGDTVPVAHLAGTRLWVLDQGGATDAQEYVSGETVDAKLLTNTSSSQLAAADADELTVTMDSRAARPYPPGNVKIGGVRYGDVSVVTGDLVLTWAHRDRILESDTLLAHGAASVGPEAGTTYTVRVYSGSTLLRTTSAISGTSWTYDSAMATADGNVHPLTIQLESSRGGLASWQHYAFDVRHYATGTFGFDYAFGDIFGGTP